MTPGGKGTSSAAVSRHAVPAVVVVVVVVTTLVLKATATGASEWSLFILGTTLDGRRAVREMVVTVFCVLRPRGAKVEVALPPGERSGLAMLLREARTGVDFELGMVLQFLGMCHNTRPN